MIPKSAPKFILDPTSNSLKSGKNSTSLPTSVVECPWCHFEHEFPGEDVQIQSDGVILWAPAVGNRPRYKERHVASPYCGPDTDPLDLFVNWDGHWVAAIPGDEEIFYDIDLMTDIPAPQVIRNKWS